MKANLYPGRGIWPDWNDLEILQRDQLPAHAYKIPFPDLVTCRHAIADNRRYISPYVIVLNSGWECRYYPNILQLPENILSFRSGFEPVAVPGSCTLTDDSPDIINRTMTHQESKGAAYAPYPFPVLPPLIPQEQPVIVYRRTCKLPLFWGGLRKHLILQGVTSACHVFLNGRPAGYAQGTGLPAEFDLTAMLHDGDNELFILVYPDCSGSYLENIAARPLPGLTGEIYFEAVPPVSLQDCRLTTTPLPDQDEGEWQLDIDLAFVSCRISLESPQVRILLCRGQEVLSDSSRPVSLHPADAQRFPPPVQTTGKLAVSLQIGSILAWSDEHPELYDLYINIEERGSRELACIHQMVGFRQIRCLQNGLEINGKPLLLKAVEWPARFAAGPGKLDSRMMVSEVRQIKQNHFNALYIRDFPADPILLEVCDIFGLYVIDEAPIFSGDVLVGAKLQSDPVWQAAACDRLERLIRRDINHPSVVLWSAGCFRNSGNTGNTLDFLVSTARRLDGSRFIHIVDTADISREMDGWQSDLAWLRLPASGAIGRCYGRWGEMPPAVLLEIRQAMRPLEVKAIDAVSGAFLFVNHMTWTSATCFAVDWLLLRNGRVILSGKLDGVKAGPGEEQYVELWYGDQSFGDGADYLLRFEFAWNESFLWADVDQEAFFCEFQLVTAEHAESGTTLRSGGRLRLESDRHHLIVSGSRFWLVFSRVNGMLESWRIGDKELISANTGMSGLLLRQAEYFDGNLGETWRLAGYDRLEPMVLSVQEGCDGQSAVIEMVILLAAPGRPAILEWISRYEVFAAGDLKCFVSVTPLLDDLPPLPCVGLALTLRSEFSHLGWYGSGPRPCFYRTQLGLRSGLFQMDPLEMSAGRSNKHDDLEGIYPDTRWLSIRDRTGFGLMVRSDQLFAFSAKPALVENRLSMLLQGRPEQHPLSVRLYNQTAETHFARPVKSVWHFTPAVSDGGRSAD